MYLFIKKTTKTSLFSEYTTCVELEVELQGGFTVLPALAVFLSHPNYPFHSSKLQKQMNDTLPHP